MKGSTDTHSGTVFALSINQSIFIQKTDRLAGNPPHSDVEIEHIIKKGRANHG